MTWIRDPRDPDVWESDGEYNGKFMANDGTLHNSPADVRMYEVIAAHKCQPAPGYEQDRVFKEMNHFIETGETTCLQVGEFVEKLYEQVRKKIAQAVCTNSGVPYDDGGSDALDAIDSLLRKVRLDKTKQV